MPHLARNRATPPRQSCSPHCCLPLFATACFFGPQGKCRLKLDWITTDGSRSVALHGIHPYVLLRLTAQGIRQKRQRSYCRIPPLAAAKLLDASICGNGKTSLTKKLLRLRGPCQCDVKATLDRLAAYADGRQRKSAVDLIPLVSLH